jgi:hypothetical protein
MPTSPHYLTVVLVTNTSQQKSTDTDPRTAGANFQGVRQRISKLRGEQKKKYEDMGWELTAEASLKAPSAKAKGEPKAKTEKEEKAKAPTKRKASADADEAGSGEGEGEGEATEKPKAKKARARKGEGKKKGAAVKEEAKEGSEDEVEGAAVKQEGDEEAI